MSELTDVDAVLDRIRRELKEREEREARKANGKDTVIQLSDFVAYMPTHSYIFKPTCEMWPASSVNARLPSVTLNGKPTAPSTWLDAHAPVEQMTWAPGEPMLVKDKLIADGGWVERPGMTVFNLYRQPVIVPKPGNVDRWLNHIRKLYPDEADHIVRWFAHRRQRPQEKINHALVFGGLQGIGKDTILEPVKRAIGPWNFSEVSPIQVLGRFNGFLRSTIIRVSEARDLGDVNRFAFYDHTKSITAAPPDVLRVDEKNLREYAVPNVVGVILTSNHKTDGIYLPADDRRHFVAWSSLCKDDFKDGYWRDLYGWYDNGGAEHVTAYLDTFDLSSFDAKAPPPKTQAFWEVVNANRAPENADLADAIDLLGSPDALTLSDVISRCTDADFVLWLRDRKNTKRVPRRLEDCHYVAVRNEDSKDEMWRVDGKRQVIYAKTELSMRDRLAAAYRRASQ